MSLKLTQTVQKGGCAAKVAAVELRRILDQVQFPPAPPNLKIGAHTFDDAAVFEMGDISSQSSSLVQTLDFFTPIVDSPRWFGRIAAANALSDVYAMGGRPITAMGILAFPLATLDTSIAVEVLQGACDTLKEAGTPLVGGHSIDDDTLKFGLSVTGIVETKQTWSNAQARVGDDLILTKALGTGAITAALKRQALEEADMQEALESMALLNNAATLLQGLEDAIHAATDITGFGLAGHSFNMAKASGCSFEINSGLLPVLPRALELIEKGYLTKAHRTNREYVEGASDFSRLSEVAVQLVMDPQTSGGLLLSVDPNKTNDVLKKLTTRFSQARKIGRVLSDAPNKLLWK